jgi:hypothetical protein
MTGENVGMAVSTAAKVTTPDEAMRAVAAAMQDAATTASEDRAEGGPPADAGASDPMQWLSRMTYTGSYALSYGLVYAAVFIAQSLPHENAVMRAFRDGGREVAEQLRDG